MNLESRGVFSQCDDYQMSVRDLCYSKNKDLSKSDRVCGSESCHGQRRLLRKRVDVAHRARNGHKTISKEFGLIHRLCTNGGNSKPLLP